MPIASAVIGIGGALISSGSAKSAANQAAAAQTAASQATIAEQRRQYDLTRGDLQPYMASGTAAQQQMNALLGINAPATTTTDWEAYARGSPGVADYYLSHNGQNLFTKGDSMSLADYGRQHYDTYGSANGIDISPYSTTVGGGDPRAAQAGAIEQLRASPLYEALFRNGQNTLLANASATGGLRGGNTQGALANFGRDTLAQVIESQLTRLSGVSGQGQNAAAQTGAFGANSANAIGQALGDQGSAQAGAALARGAATSSAVKDITGALSGLASNQSIQQFAGKLF